jgi:hypothetical protein
MDYTLEKERCRFNPHVFTRHFFTFQWAVYLAGAKPGMSAVQFEKVGNHKKV